MGMKFIFSILFIFLLNLRVLTTTSLACPYCSIPTPPPPKIPKLPPKHPPNVPKTPAPKLPSPPPPTVTPKPPPPKAPVVKPPPKAPVVKPPPPPTVKPSPPPPTPPPRPSQETCPIDTLKLGGCVDLLGGIVQIGIGGSVKEECCPVLEGLVDLDAAICLCTTIKAKLLNLNIILPIALQVLIDCGKEPPPGFKCPA
ncbi:Bifunctional inhibitor/plant lipid transfer protein/seed storage helical domain [Macleaya cordata]|uniref:Bifunctional inhibitor/plant lipid transfer protein/seed storage helical domain n=1 Tax=Macleaya cordata TaxID=56857 RepID=A0A200QZ02_MACCD|nr:Bifunctional inhibitor/plant lipid transfer protein/seed storage helical domain [Macleaya cordata]